MLRPVAKQRPSKWKPRIRQERERKPIQSTLTPLTGSQRENARRYLSGELIRALTFGDRYWRGGFDKPSLLAEGGNATNVRLFGPGRAPPETYPDFYTLRFRARGAILGAEGGMFPLLPQMIVLQDHDFFLAVATLHNEGLCCERCSGDDGIIYEKHQGYATDDEGNVIYNKRGRAKRARCILNELLLPAQHADLWLSYAEAVVKVPGIPDEYIRTALILFDRAVFYDATPRPIKTLKERRKEERNGGR